MNFLLDTNVLSEVRRSQPDRRVLAWLDQVDEDRVYLSVISIAEIARGVALLDEGSRKSELAQWLEHELPARFDGRIVPADAPAALIWGKLLADAKRGGSGLSVMDGWIAAIALAKGLTLVTRNTKDFLQSGVSLFDPWADKAI